MNRLLLLLFVLPAISLSQAEIHSYQIIADTMIYDTGNYKIGYRKRPMKIAIENYAHMTDKLLVINGEEYSYDDNKITIGGTIYKFKRPWFATTTLLINYTTDEEFIEFTVDDHAHKVVQRLRTAQMNKLSDIDREILSIWALFKQVEYSFYHHDHDEDTDDDC